MTRNSGFLEYLLVRFVDYKENDWISWHTKQSRGPQVCDDVQNKLSGTRGSVQRGMDSKVLLHVFLTFRFVFGCVTRVFKFA
jgi:hypothetical protein